MANIMMRFPGGRPKALTFSYDDNVEQDARLIELFDKYGLHATFNINSGRWAPEGFDFPKGYIHRRLPASAAAELYKNHEVATHGFTHPFLDRLSDGCAAFEIMKDRETLEAMFGRVVRGHAYPYGTFNADTAEILRRCGIAYARCVETTGDFALPEDWLHLRGTCHHGDPRLMELARRFVYETPKRVPRPYCDPWLFYVWGHSYEFEETNNWKVMEDFCAYVSRREDVWYATNIEIFDYCAAFKALCFSADGRVVYNPSALELCFAYENEGSFAVRPGETARLF